MRNVLMMTMFSATTALAVAFFTGCEDNSEPTDYNTVPAVGQLTISPPGATLADTITFAVFTANGGVGPYNWSVSDKALGAVPDTTGNTITYTRTASAYGANLVIVTDNNGWSAQAVVQQTAPTNATATGATP
jgi:hypothetical protein